MGQQHGASRAEDGRRRIRLAVSPQFFKTMGTPLLDGRELQPSDTDAANPMAVIVNEAFARNVLSRESARSAAG